jgi:actin-like ATPase involved in cell morphogenesis
MEVKGRDLVSGIPKTVRVHSSEIREAIQEPIQQIVDAVAARSRSRPRSWRATSSIAASS